MTLACQYRCLIVLAFALAPGCGDDSSFSGGSGLQIGGNDATVATGDPDGPAAPPAEDGVPPDGAPYDSVHWFWQCEAEPTSPPAPSSANQVVVVGAGEHNLDADRIQSTPLVVSGKICAPEQLERDIVFAIDVSLSTLFSDPVDSAGSCGRLRAVEAVLAQLPAGGNHRLGLVTFADNIQATSAQMYETKDQLYAALTGGGARTPGQVICGMTGGTNYQGALNGATNVFQSGRANASKELYFVSDGEPDGGQEGIAEATTLKQNGITIGGTTRLVTIATVMLNGEDQVLEQQIASRDANNIPLHEFAANAGELADALASLSDNEIVGGQLRYRPIGSSADHTIIDISDQVAAYDFEAPEITITVEDAPNGIEFIYEYFDRNNNTYASEGKLVWGQVP